MINLRLGVISACCLIGLGALQAQQKPRIATVDAAELFAKYYRTDTEKDKLSKEHQKTVNDPRVAVITKTREELAKLNKQARSTSYSEDSRQEYFRQYQMKLHELRSLERDTIQYRQSRQKEINRQLVAISKILMSEVQSTVQRVAAAQHYDLVLDVSGDTSSQVPTLIYIRDATDITSQVLKELNRHKPAPLPAGVTPMTSTRTPTPAAPSPPIPVTRISTSPDPTPPSRIIPNE